MTADELQNDEVVSDGPAEEPVAGDVAAAGDGGGEFADTGEVAASEAEELEEPVDIELEEERLMAALAYVVVFVPWVMARDNEFVQFHVKQGVVLFVGLLISLVALFWIPFVGRTLVILFLIADVVALAQALLGRSWKIPGVGRLAEKLRI